MSRKGFFAMESVLRFRFKKEILIRYCRTGIYILIINFHGIRIPKDKFKDVEIEINSVMPLERTINFTKTSK